MKNYDRITMGRLAKEQGFVRDTLEKVCRLTDILLFIQQDDYLFDDDSILKKIADHPMAIWKCTAKEAQPPVRKLEG